MLTIPIDPLRKEPIYEQIYTYIRREIKEGNLLSGMKLPSTRGLARHLLVSRNTVDRAFGQLVSEGYIESRPQRGYFVSEISSLTDIAFPEHNIKKTVSPKKQKWKIDFSPDGVDMEAFPYNRWRKLTKEAMIDDNKELFQTGDPMGDPALRKAIRQYLHQSRGVECQEEQILIGAGLDYLLLLLCQVLGKGRKVAMEKATYKQAYRIFQQMEYQVFPIDIDSKGISMTDLETSPADLVYVMPSHQFPTGIVMPINRRHQLISWACEKEERYIIEDDYDSEFRYQGKPIPSLQASDPLGKVIYAGTFSKAIAPGIRVSYLVLPWKLVKQFRERAGFYSCSVSRIDQTILRYFIEEGYFERHLNKMRGIYKNKQEFFLKELKKMPIQMKISGESAGLHILMRFPKQTEEKQLVTLAAEKGIKVYPVSEYMIEKMDRGTEILLGFARLSEEEIQKGIRLLTDAWKPFWKATGCEKDRKGEQIWTT